MQPLRTDLTIFKGLKLPRSPVAVKFSFFEPEGIQPLPPQNPLSLCEMIAEAQNASAAFFVNKTYPETCVGRILLGMQEMQPFAESGQIGEKLGIFQEARANYALYKHVPKFDRNIINYVVFSPLSTLTFEPDLLVFCADHEGAEIIMRATAYSSGELYISMTTPVMGCAWLVVYPFQSGKVNYLLPDMIHGMKGRELFPNDSVLISIPYNWIPTVACNLAEMPWHLPSHTGRKAYLEEFGSVLRQLSDKAPSSIQS